MGDDDDIQPGSILFLGVILAAFILKSRAIIVCFRFQDVNEQCTYCQKNNEHCRNKVAPSKSTFNGFCKYHKCSRRNGLTFKMVLSFDFRLYHCTFINTVTVKNLVTYKHVDDPETKWTLNYWLYIHHCILYIMFISESLCINGFCKYVIGSRRIVLAFDSMLSFDNRLYHCTFINTVTVKNLVTYGYDDDLETKWTLSYWLYIHHSILNIMHTLCLLGHYICLMYIYLDVFVHVCFYTFVMSFIHQQYYFFASAIFRIYMLSHYKISIAQYSFSSSSQFSCDGNKIERHILGVCRVTTHLKKPEKT